VCFDCDCECFGFDILMIWLRKHKFQGTRSYAVVELLLV
jgi:hypothetical protein